MRWSALISEIKREKRSEDVYCSTSCRSLHKNPKKKEKADASTDTAM